MQDLDDFLTHIATNVDGSLYVALGGMDGLLIEQFPKDQDLFAFAAEFANVTSALERLSKAGLEGGEVKEVMVSAEQLISYARLLNEDLFLLVLMNRSGNLGKARLYTEQAAPKLLEQFT